VKRNQAHPCYVNGNTPTGMAHMPIGRYVESVRYGASLTIGNIVRRNALRYMLDDAAQVADTDTTMALLDTIEHYTPSVPRCMGTDTDCNHTQSVHDWDGCLHDTCECTLRYGRGVNRLNEMIMAEGYMI
jgi:hypothetical protein